MDVAVFAMWMHGSCKTEKRRRTEMMKKIAFALACCLVLAGCSLFSRGEVKEVHLCDPPTEAAK